MTEIRELFYKNEEINSDKVYVARLSGCEVLLQWGRRNTTLQQQKKVFSSTYEARQFWNKKISEKVSEGYKATTTIVGSIFTASNNATPIDQLGIIDDLLNEPEPPQKKHKHVAKQDQHDEFKKPIRRFYDD